MFSLTASFVLCFAVVAYGFPEPQIIGGKIAPAGKFPYEVSLRSNGNHFCGGSIISSRYILTAAHCVKAINDLKSITVHAGTNQLSARGDVYQVEKAVVHRDYSDSKLVNDVGLYRLNRNIAFNNLVKSIPLASGSNTYEGAACVLSGWGTTNMNGKVPNDLQYLNLKVESQTKCKRIFGNVQASHICTFTKYGEGACYGDSGSPLVANGVQIGIASFVRPCAIGSPDVYTRVSSFNSWIKAQQQYLMNEEIEEQSEDAIYYS